MWRYGTTVFKTAPHPLISTVVRPGPALLRVEFQEPTVFLGAIQCLVVLEDLALVGRSKMLESGLLKCFAEPLGPDLEPLFRL